MAQRGLKGLQLRQVSSPKRMFETVRDYMVALPSEASSGGAAQETMVVSGLKADDEIVAVSQMTAGANSEPMIAWSGQADEALDIDWPADPGAGAVVKVLVRRLK